MPDVGILISDIVMPGGMDGQALCLAARQSSPHVKTLLISGYADAYAGPPDMAGGMALLKKPFTVLELQHALAGLQA